MFLCTLTKQCHVMTSKSGQCSGIDFTGEDTSSPDEVRRSILSQKLSYTTVIIHGHSVETQSPWSKLTAYSNRQWIHRLSWKAIVALRNPKDSCTDKPEISHRDAGFLIKCLLGNFLLMHCLHFSKIKESVRCQGPQFIIDWYIDIRISL